MKLTAVNLAKNSETGARKRMKCSVSPRAVWSERTKKSKSFLSFSPNTSKDKWQFGNSNGASPLVTLDLGRAPPLFAGVSSYFAAFPPYTGLVPQRRPRSRSAAAAKLAKRSLGESAKLKTGNQVSARPREPLHANSKIADFSFGKAGETATSAKEKRMDPDAIDSSTIKAKFIRYISQHHESHFYVTSQELFEAISPYR